jgi:hypothetical protein
MKTMAIEPKNYFFDCPKTHGMKTRAIEPENHFLDRPRGSNGLKAMAIESEILYLIASGFIRRTIDGFCQRALAQCVPNIGH